MQSRKTEDQQRSCWNTWDLLLNFQVSGTIQTGLQGVFTQTSKPEDKSRSCWIPGISFKSRGFGHMHNTPSRVSLFKPEWLDWDLGGDLRIWMKVHFCQKRHVLNMFYIDRPLIRRPLRVFCFWCGIRLRGLRWRSSWKTEDVVKRMKQTTSILYLINVLSRVIANWVNFYDKRWTSEIRKITKVRRVRVPFDIRISRRIEQLWFYAVVLIHTISFCKL